MNKSMPIIGIPRALFYYKQPEFWPAFFEELGCQVIVSPFTNREILEKGCQVSETESCLSVKIFQGHINFLLDKVDYIFIPRIISLRRNHLSCPKFFGLPDLARLLSVEQKILSPTIDFNKESFQKTILKFGWRLTRNIFKIKRAYQKASAAEEKAKEGLKEDYLAQINSFQKKIVLISHPYNLYDDFVNLGIKDKLIKLGVRVIFIDRVPFEFRSTFAHWDFAAEMLNQVREISQQAIAGAIQISTFNCGCDSVIKEFIEAQFKAKKIPYLSLIIDEHTGEAGLVTRLEAFVDTLN
jgi:predicted nucleotide-binding protein (sugar kinase/HSP70/actin superfamily)